MRSVTQPVKEVFHLVAPQLALVFNLTFIGKVLYDEDGLVSDLGFFYSELEELFLRSVLPMKSDKFFKFAFGDFGSIGRPIPGEAEYIVAFIYFICEPLLKSCGSA